MKKADIRATVEAHLATIGIRTGAFKWQPASAELFVIVGDGFRSVKLKSGISQRELLVQLGRITGWLEMATGHEIAAMPSIVRAPVKKRAVNGAAHPEQSDLVDLATQFPANGAG